MYPSPERIYYLERARTSLALAAQAASPLLASVHRELHQHYLLRADEAELPPPLVRQGAR